MEKTRCTTQDEPAAMLDDEKSHRKKPIKANLNSKRLDKQRHENQNNLNEQRYVNFVGITIETFEPSMNAPRPKLSVLCKPENDATRVFSPESGRSRSPPKVLTTAERQNLFSEEIAVVEGAKKYIISGDKFPDFSEVSFSNLGFPPSKSFTMKKMMSTNPNENLIEQSSTSTLIASTPKLCSSCSKINLSTWGSEPCTPTSLEFTPDSIPYSSRSLPTESSKSKTENNVTNNSHQFRGFRLLRPLDYITSVIKEDDYEFTPWRKRAEAAITAVSINIPSTSKAAFEKSANYEVHCENTETPFNVLEDPQAELDAYIEIRNMLLDLTIDNGPSNNNPIPTFESYADYLKSDNNSMEHAGALQLYNLSVDELYEANTNLSSDENVDKFFQDEFAKMDCITSPSSLNSDVLSNPPFTYEDCEVQEMGPKPMNWVEIQAQREIGRPVAVFDSRDFNPKYNIEPLWLDPEFNFDAPINRNYNLNFEAHFDTPEEATLLDKCYTEEKILAFKQKQTSIYTPENILQYKKAKKNKSPKKEIPKRVEVSHMREPRQSYRRPQLCQQHFHQQYQARCQAQFIPRYKQQLHQAYCRSKYGLPHYSRYRAQTNTSRKQRRRPNLSFYGTVLTTIPEKRDLEEEEERKMAAEMAEMKPEPFIPYTNYESDPDISDGEFLFTDTIIVESSNRKFLYAGDPRPPSPPLPSPPPFPIPPPPPLPSGVSTAETYASKLKKAISAPDISTGAIPKIRKTRIFSRSPTPPKLVVKQCKSSPMLTGAAIKNSNPKMDFMQCEPSFYPPKPSLEQFKNAPADNQQALPFSRRPERKKNINVYKKKPDERPRPPKNLKLTFNSECTKLQTRPQETHLKNEENSSRAKKTLEKYDNKSLTPELKPISLPKPDSRPKLDPKKPFGEPLIIELLPESTNSPLASLKEPLSSSPPSSFAFPCSEDEPIMKQPLEDVQKSDVTSKPDFDTGKQEESIIREKNLEATCNDTELAICTTPKCLSPEPEDKNEEISPISENILEDDEQELAFIMAELIPELQNISSNIPSPILNSDSESDSETSNNESVINELNDLELSLVEELFSSLSSSPRLPLCPIPEEFTAEASTSSQGVNVPDFSKVHFIQLPSSQKTSSRVRSSKSAKKQPEPIPDNTDYHPRGCRRLEKLLRNKKAKKNRNQLNQLAQKKDESKRIEAQLRNKRINSIFSLRIARWARKKEKGIMRKYTMKVLLCSTFTFLLVLYSFTSCILCIL